MKRSTKISLHWDHLGSWEIHKLSHQSSVLVLSERYQYSCSELLSLSLLAYIADEFLGVQKLLVYCILFLTVSINTPFSWFVLTNSTRGDTQCLSKKLHITATKIRKTYRNQRNQFRIRMLGIYKKKITYMKLLQST